MAYDQLLADLSALAAVVIIDIVLAGDNALVVGLAASGVEPERRRQVVTIGIAIALVTRVAFAVVTTEILALTGLLLAGGLLLAWVAWKLWRDLAAPAAEPVALDNGPAEPAPVAPKSFRAAVWQVALADISMSLDNVLAVAGAARDHVWMLVFGLLLSISLMGVAAVLIAKFMQRHRWLGFVGLAVVAYVAVSMIYRGAQDVVRAVGWF